MRGSVVDRNGKPVVEGPVVLIGQCLAIDGLEPGHVFLHTETGARGSFVFREVAGECASYFNPHDAQSIADTMEELARDDALRSDLSARGVERARRFSWEATAKKMHAVFAEAVR